MNIQNEEERQAAAHTLKEVMEKLQEAWRLARELEQNAAHKEREHAGAGRG